jgi:hypothetical protein
MNTQNLIVTPLRQASAFKSYASTRASTLARLAAGNGHSPEIVLGVAANFYGAAEVLRLVAGKLAEQVREAEKSIPLLTPLGDVGRARAFAVNRTARRLDVFLALLETTEEDERLRLKEKTLAKTVEKLMPVAKSGERGQSRREWLEFITRSPAIFETVFTRALIASRELAIPRQEVETVVAAALQNFSRKIGVAPTKLRGRERTVAIRPIGSARIRGPRLELIGVNAEGRSFQDTFSQAFFPAGTTLVVNAGSLP